MGEKGRWVMLNRVLDVAASVATLVAAVTVTLALILRPTRPADRPARLAPPAEMQVADLSTFGAPDAPVVVALYIDYECPYCRTMWRDILPSFVSDRVETGEVQIALRNVPMPQHPGALNLARAAVCAGRQGRPREFGNLAFAGESLSLDSDASVSRAAGKVGLTVGLFTSCLRDASSMEAVSLEANTARTWGIVATPTSVVGVRLPGGRVKLVRAIPGLPTLAALNDAVDSALLAER